MSGISSVPFLDLVTPHVELKEEICGVVQKALETAGFIGGPMVKNFEDEFAMFCHTKHCVGVGSGTDALRFAMLAAGIEPGEIVVTVAHTFIATTEAISQAGAKTVFVDIDEATFNLDPAKLREYLEKDCDFNAATQVLTERKSGRRVRGVIPVHIYGQMADLDPIMELTERYGLILIEDACQAHGAEYFSSGQNRWLKAGSAGLAAAFSFYPGKNLGACGEAGAVTTNDGVLAQKIRMIRDHGQATKYYHDVEGYNGRLDSIQAGILSVKLKHLADWNDKRRAAAQTYRKLFGEAAEGIVLPHEPSWSKAVYHLFVIRTTDRERLQKDLAEDHIGTGIHYPIPLHQQKAYAGLGYAQGSLPVVERIAGEIVSLPMFPGITPEQQSRVVERVLQLVSCPKV